MKFIHTADLHLDSPLQGLENYPGAPVEKLRCATRQAFKELVNYACEEKIDFILIAGDIYDGDWKDYHTGLFFGSQMARLRQAGIPVYLIAGNHDAASQITKSLKPHDNVQIFSDRHPETKILPELGVAIHAQGFARRSVVDDLSQDYPPALAGYLNLGMLHTSATGRPGHENYAPCTVAGLLSKGYEYWALGHVHHREVLHERPWIVFPGNLQGRHIRETGAKGFTLVTANASAIECVEAVVADVLRWAVCAVAVDGAMDPEDVLDRVRVELAREGGENEGKPLALRLLITGACTAHQQLVAQSQKWTNEIRHLAGDIGEIWIEKIKWQTQPPRLQAEMDQRHDALSALGQTFTDLKAQPDEFAKLFAALAPLKKQLGELPDAPPLFDLDNADYRNELIDDVQQLLITNLAMSTRPV